MAGRIPDVASDAPDETVDFGLVLDAAPEATDLDDIEIHLDLGDDDEPTAEADIVLDFGDDDSEVDHDAGVKLDDSDDVAEAVRAKLRAEMQDKAGDWYVVHTYAGMEKRVKQNLDSRVKTLNMEDYIFEAVVPTEEVDEIRNNQKKTVTRTVIPGYVLVRMDMTDDSWAAVRHTPSVTGFVGHANDPVPLDLDEVIGMLLPSAIAIATASEDGKSTTRKKKIELVDFRVGDSVILTDGPFTGVHATITEINVHSQRLKATLEFMGRDTPVDLTLDQVQKI
jgi:transcriptional antiterminator NusG